MKKINCGLKNLVLELFNTMTDGPQKNRGQKKN